MAEKTGGKSNLKNLRARLSIFVYDILIFAVTVVLMYVLYRGDGKMEPSTIIIQSGMAFVAVFGVRWLSRVYRQIWRYGGIQCYIRLLISDAIACLLYITVGALLAIPPRIACIKMLALCSMNLLGSLAIRMLYHYVYKCGTRDTAWGKRMRWVLRFVSGGRVTTEARQNEGRIKIAIIGAGSVGVDLAEEMWTNPRGEFDPRCFVDNNAEKSGRDIHGVPVLNENEALNELKKRGILDVVMAIPGLGRTQKLELYERYSAAGFRVRVFDYPPLEFPARRREVRDFQIEDLLAREQKELVDAKTREYYHGKKILITGGGGSIGSELCRQLARMGAKQIILVDIYENSAYDVQQGMMFAYKGEVDVRVEIVSITNKERLAKVFAEYHPDICINAAAHKHVPLMEKNCVEAVENNVFGALNVIKLCEEYGCGRFMMVSTDKAVNPTNVMGATKRVCEMIMQAYSTRGKVKCSATRFGNVLGSAGSVIPLFRRQISAGGPVTVTDKRIIRYFMTIPEASQLVLVSGAMANNGEIFVLDMGKPVKILDLARNMIRLSGAEDIEIVETGLRPGEKLYEELLVKSDELQKTDNDLIFVEKEEPITMDELDKKLDALREACTDDEVVKRVMRDVVPTYRSPEEVNQAKQDYTKPEAQVKSNQPIFS